MIDVNDSVLDDARQCVAFHIKKNIYKSFNFRISDVMSMSLMLSLFNPLQTSLQIDVIRDDLKKSRENKKLKNKKRDLRLQSKHVAEHEITKENVNE
jgi:hypothetical protein